MERCSHAKEMDLLLPASNHKNMKNFAKVLPYFFYDGPTNKTILQNLSPLTKTFPHNFLDQKFELNSQFRSFYQITMDESNDPAYGKYVHALFDNFLYYQSRYSWFKAEGGLRDTPGSTPRKPSSIELEIFEKIKLVEKYNLTDYDVFNAGRVKIGKEERKLFRFCKQNGLLNDTQIDILNSEKTKGGLLLCISRNPVDYLFASTNQSYSSCISLESEAEGCFYMGLAGLTVDPNRFMLFVTNGAIKHYNVKGYEFKHFKYISRSWGIMSKHDKLHVVGAYPADKIGIEKQLRSIGWDTDGFADSRHYNESLMSFELPKHEDGSKSSIYMDSPGMTNRHNRTGSGKWYHTNDGGICGSLCDFSFGGPFEEVDCFDTLLYDSRYCESCERRVHEDNSSYYDDFGTICEECFSEYYFYCYHCSDVELQDNGILVDHEMYCPNCIDRFFARCNKCGEYCHDHDMQELDHEFYCPDCYEDITVECDHCLEDVNKQYTKVGPDDGVYCQDCFDELWERCDVCNQYIELEEIAKVGMITLCHDCNSKERSEDEAINDAV